jgi:hypothetical protein
MIDPDELLVRAVAEALDESGLSPGSDEEDARAFLRMLWERGYEVTKTAPAAPED